jgi:uncharacterized protein (TIGR02466 family)|tara:strand:+ start:5072 stop:5722 length:651 start_codon:yes stop_codon:yes gene_type:complete
MIELKRDNYFISPIYYGFDDSFVKDLNKITNPYIKEARKRNKELIKKTKDFSLTHHSTSLIPEVKMRDFQKMINDTAYQILTKDQGYNLNEYKLFITELWVQEFSKNGGGWHEIHTHWNGHISGFYFLKGSEQTSRPVFHDPRSGKVMNDLPMLDKNKVNDAQSSINYIPKPGTMIFFPSYLPHSYVVDHGKEPFRFIHWNIQAIPKGALDHATSK